MNLGEQHNKNDENDFQHSTVLQSLNGIESNLDSSEVVKNQQSKKFKRYSK